MENLPTNKPQNQKRKNVTHHFELIHILKTFSDNFKNFKLEIQKFRRKMDNKRDTK